MLALLSVNRTGAGTMDAIANYLDANALAIACNTVLLVIVYLIARLARLRPLPALASGFLPLYGLIALSMLVMPGAA